MRYAAKIDTTQPDIVAGLRAMGATVLLLHRVGGGCPDLLVAWHFQNVLIEVKSPGGRLNEAERRFFDDWRGPAIVAYSLDDAVTQLDRVTGRGGVGAMIDNIQPSIIHT